jgi:hypothetical protein
MTPVAACRGIILLVADRAPESTSEPFSTSPASAIPPVVIVFVSVKLQWFSTST